MTDEQDFQQQVIADLSEIKGDVKAITKIVDGHNRTLYGPTGCEGVVKAVADNRHKNDVWNKLLSVAVVIFGGLATFAGALASWIKWGAR